MISSESDNSWRRQLREKRRKQSTDLGDRITRKLVVVSSEMSERVLVENAADVLAQDAFVVNLLIEHGRGLRMEDNIRDHTGHKTLSRPGRSAGPRTNNAFAPTYEPSTTPLTTTPHACKF